MTADRPRPSSATRLAAAGGGALSETDIEILALGLDLQDSVLIHDRRAFEVGEAAGVTCLDLAMVLEALKDAGVLPTRKEMFDVVFRLETLDGADVPSSRESQTGQVLSAPEGRRVRRAPQRLATAAVRA